jgi:hypothetical protein
MIGALRAMMKELLKLAQRNTGRRDLAIKAHRLQM